MSPERAFASTAASFRNVRLAIDAGRATVTLARPPLNVINAEMIGELRPALREAAARAKVLVLRGDGRMFSAGADVEEHLPGRVEAMLSAFVELGRELAAVEIPTVAYLHGAALGGGLELALPCDLVYAAPGTKLGQPEIALGVIAPVAAAYLPGQIGIRRTQDLLLSGRSLAPEEALDWGLINGIVDSDGFEAIVQGLLTRSRPALLATKKAVRSSVLRSFNDAARDGLDLYLNELMKAEDPVEGLKAFLEKRPPAFRDR